HGHEEEGVEPFGKRRFENFGFHGRATAVFETGPTSTLQVGGSVAYAPKVVRFFEDALMTPFKATFETRIAGVDATYRDYDEASGTGFVTVAEALWSSRELSDDGIVRRDVDAFGFYAYAEAFVARQWSLGASGGRFEHAEDASERSSDYGAFATWRIDEFQRLRLEARRFEDPGQDSFGVSLQWTVILGTHGHGIYW
ncbi:MAG TPA: hypothetical protein PKE00_14145, partial [Planctomycetota bacterium]|nr:hypothetical protein [Planctomycetota bacterium]